MLFLNALKNGTDTISPTVSLLKPRISSRRNWLSVPAFQLPLILPACLLLFATALFGQSNAEPGKTDPVGSSSRYTLFPDQSVLAFVPGGSMAGTLNPRLYRTSGNPQLRLGNVTALPSQPWNPAPIAAAAGRILTPNNDQVVYARRSGTNVEVNFVNQPSTQTTYLPGLADRLSQNTDFIAIAAGDLDKAADAQRNYHDEVVVAYATPGTDKQLNLSVLNYTDGSTPVVTTLNTFGPQKDIFQLTPSTGDSRQGGVLPFDNVVGVAIGDFDNDGNNEIAVAYVARRPYLEIDTYRYVSDGNGGHSLTIVGLAAFTMQQNSLPLLGAISVKAGDFNGDGVAELAVGWGYWQGESRLPSSTPALTIFQFGGSNGLTALKMGSAYAPPVSAPQLPQVQVAAGQFFFNPPSIPFGRQQVVLAWNDVPRGGATMQLYQVSDDLKSLALSSGTTTVLSRPASHALQMFSVVAGGFMGNANPKQPTASLALSFWADYVTYIVATIAVTSNPKPPLQVLSVADLVAYTTGGVDPTSRMPLVAVDWDGKSVYLGAPAHITVQDAVSTDFILEEPPKHAYFDEDKKQVVTVTRLDSNNVHLNNGQTDEFSGTSTDHTNWAIGGSLAVSAGTTIGAGLDIGIVKGSAEASIDGTARSSYDYDQKKTTFNSQYGSRGIDSTGQTDNDDFLKGRSENLDVWRYRIYSLNQLTPQTNNFYDVILPGPTTPFDGGGLNFSWYQPIHENGNILSYPAALGKTPGNPYLPSDLGTFTLPNGKAGSGPQVPAALSFFDGTGSTSTLRYSSEVASGGSFEYSHALSESLDIKASAKASVEVRGIRAEQRISAEAEFHNSNSWGGKSTNDISTTNLTKITLNRSSGNGNQTYPFYPVIYSTLDGTVKMSFALPNPSVKESNNAGFGYWAKLYGGKPDPALNLVRRFDPDYSPVTGILTGWTPNFQNNRKYMRGLFFRKSAANSITGAYDFLADNPTDGDTIRIEARIYNYSTAQTAYNIPVILQAIPWDSSLDSEICSTPINGKPGAKTGLVCPASARTTIGQIVVPKLNPLQFTCLQGTDDPAVTGCASSAFLNWNTKGFGPASSGAAQYRIYVVLDPNNTIDQTYGGEGSPVAITNVTNTSPLIVTTASPHGLSTGDYVVIGNVQGLTTANGDFPITWISPTSFSLDGSRVGQNAYSGGGTAILFDPGQNNEGFGYVNVSYQAGLSASDEPQSAADDYLATDSVQAIDYRTATLTGTSITAYQNRPLRVRITAFSSVAHPYGADLLLYDGDPSDGASAIAEQRIDPGNNGTDGVSIWIDWTPPTMGVHHLYARLQESPGDPQPGNNTATLDVNVLRSGDINGDGQINKADLNLLLKNLGKSVESSSCGLLCDIDGDGRISVLDARKLVLMCNTAGCAGQ